MSDWKPLHIPKAQAGSKEWLAHQAQAARDLAVANSDKTVGAKLTSQGDLADGNLNVAEAQKLFNAEGDTSDG